MSKEDDKRIASNEDAELRKMLGEDEPEKAPESESDRAQKEALAIVGKLVDGFLANQKEVVKQSNENRSGLQDEIAHLHKILVDNSGPKPIRDVELETLAKLRQIQTDQTANRIQLMDSAARMISAMKHLMKDSGTSKKSKGDDSLRDVLNDDSHEDSVL